MSNAILFGGVSLEHEISIISAFQVKSFFEDIYMIYFDKNFNIYDASKMTLDDFKKCKLSKLKPIYFCKNGFKSRFNKKNIECAIILIHGQNGEDGALKGMLDLYDISSVGCDMFNSSLFMNKYLSHKALSCSGYLVSDCYLLNKKDFVFANYKNNYPCIVKPNCGGSSIGVVVCYNEPDFVKNVIDIFKYSDEVIVEEYLEDCEEYNVAVAEKYVSNVFKVKSKGEIFSFSDKYEQELKLNNELIDNELSNKLIDISKKVYLDFKLTGIVRVDFLVKEDKIYICELNTIPGSLSSYMFSNFNDVLMYQISKAKLYNYKKKQHKDCFKSNLLNINKFSK